MRNAFAAELVELAKEYPELVLLTGDMGNRLFDNYKLHFPDRFYNCGVAEANMASVAAGMAMCGLKPVTYSIASFNTLRCLEQIKIDICYHNLPVIIVGVGAGLSYAELGPTHQSCEDISIMRSLPGMTVICPGDAVEVKLSLKSAVYLGKPVYLRLGKKNEPIVHKSNPEFKVGKAISIKEGNNICIISTGNVLPIAVNTAKLLEEQNLSAGLYSMHTVKPLDYTTLEKIFSKYSVIATIEEHSLIGGLGSAISEWLIDRKNSNAVKLFRFGCNDIYPASSCNQKCVRTQANLNPQYIANQLYSKFL